LNLSGWTLEPESSTNEIPTLADNYCKWLIAV
jgi:hypothetical protein